MNHQGTYSKKITSYHYTPPEMTKIQKTNTWDSSQDLEQQGPSCSAGSKRKPTGKRAFSLTFK